MKYMTGKAKMMVTGIVLGTVAAGGMAALNRVRTYALIDSCSPFYSNLAAMAVRITGQPPHAKSRHVGIEKYLTVGRNHFAKPCFSPR